MNFTSTLKSIFISFICLAGLSCSREQPTETNTSKDIKIEVIGINNTPAVTDSSYYYKEYTEWNTPTSFWDTVKANSLAELLLTTTENNVTDMWFAGVHTRCIGRPIKTENWVIIKLSAPNTNIIKLGFEQRKSIPFDACYDLFRHYTIKRAR